MNLSISNIAWEAREDIPVYRLMNKYGFSGLEIAPSRVWGENPPTDIPSHDVKRYLKELAAFGIRPVAFQALLFGKPELRIFESEDNRNETLQYLKSMIRLAGMAGVRILVFGSPRNRNTGALSPESSRQLACSFFHDLGVFACRHDTVFCIEPNPKEYKTDFINNTEEALNLVAAVNHPGFRLHVDTGTMVLNGEPAGRTISRAFEFMAHLHVSEPFLAPVIPEQSVSMHREISSVLKMNDYNGWISIEMKKDEQDNNLPAVEKALRSVAEIYS
jgi:sugar phosphate isomerase/epimerase